MNGPHSLAFAAVLVLAPGAGASAQAPAPTPQGTQPPAATAAAGEPLTLDAAIALALLQNRELQSSTLDIEKAEDGIELARMNLRPVFDSTFQIGQRVTPLRVTFPAGAFGSYPGTGPIPSTDTTISSPTEPVFFAYLTAAQPLTQLGRIKLGIQASTVARDIERERMRGRSQRTIFNVRQAYYALLQSDAALRATEASLEAAREVDRVIAERAERQVVLAADAADAKVRLAQAEQARLSLQHTLASQKEQLNQLLGRDVRTPFALVPVPDLPVADSDLDAAISRAKADRPEVREARLRVEQADLDRRIAESQKIPDISLSAVYVTLANVDFLPRNLASVGLQLSWEPFDWGRKSREAAQKGRTVQQARLALADTEDRVALDVLAATRRLEDRRSELRVAALTQDAAAERLRERSEQAKVDAALFADLLQARSQLADASARHQQAIAAYWNARADAERALGVDRR